MTEDEEDALLRREEGQAARAADDRLMLRALLAGRLYLKYEPKDDRIVFVFTNWDKPLLPLDADGIPVLDAPTRERLRAAVEGADSAPAVEGREADGEA